MKPDVVNGLHHLIVNMCTVNVVGVARRKTLAIMIHHAAYGGKGIVGLKLL